MTQTQKLKELLDDNMPHSTYEICASVYGNAHYGIARVGARIWDLRQKYLYEVIGWHDTENPSLYWYAHLPNSWKIIYEDALKRMDKRDAWYYAEKKSREMKVEAIQGALL